MNAAKIMFAAVLLCQIRCKSHYVEISLLKLLLHSTTLLAAAGNAIHIFSFQVNSQFPNIAVEYVHIVKLFVEQPFSHSSAELSTRFNHFKFLLSLSFDSEYHLDNYRHF